MGIVDYITNLFRPNEREEPQQTPDIIPDIPKELTQEDVMAALNSYRESFDPVLMIINQYLGEGVTNIAFVHENYGFVYGVSVDVLEGGMRRGNIDEIFFMCQEMIDFSPTAKRPDENKSIGQNAIDTILEVEKGPFIMFAYDENTYNYALSLAENQETVSPGIRCQGPGLEFILCKGEDIAGNFEMISSIGRE